MIQVLIGLTGADAHEGASAGAAGLSLGSHDRVALTGPNGSGKTTLLDLIRGHLPPDLPVLVMEQEVGDDKADEWLRTFRDLPGDGWTAVLHDYSQIEGLYMHRYLLRPVSSKAKEVSPIYLYYGS